MRRYWIDKECFVKNDLNEDVVLLQGDDFRHICGVCRRDVGDKFEVLTEDSKAYFVTIIEKSSKAAFAKVLEAREVPSLPEPHIELCVSLPKFKKMDEIVEKSVEMGAHRVRPFFSDFSAIKDKSKLSENKLLRWSKIVKSATQQSGRGDLMDVSEAVSLAELLDGFKAEEASVVGLFAYEGACEKSFKQVSKELSQRAPRKILVFVGSEGGFSEREVQLFKSYGLEPLSLGDQILRVETACLALLSIIKYELVMS